MDGRGNLFSQDYLTSRCFEAFDLTQVFIGFDSTYDVSYHRVLFVHLAHGWYKCESAQPIAGMES